MCLMTLAYCVLVVFPMFDKEYKRDLPFIGAEVALVCFFLIYLVLQFLLEMSWRSIFRWSVVTDIFIIFPFFISLYVDFYDEGYFVFFRPLCFFKFYLHGIQFLGTRQMRKLIPPVKYFLIKLYFSVLTIIFVTSLYVYTTERLFDNPDITLDNSFYFVLVTLSTVGYGDITPTTFVGRMVVIVLILTAVIVFPLQISRLVERMNAQPESGEYVLQGSVPHVVLTGNISITTLKKFLQEFYDADRGSITPMLVLLFSEITDEHKLLLQDPLYNRLVKCINVSMSDFENTIKNIEIDKAQSVFILANDKGDTTKENVDATSIMQVLLFRKYNSRILIFTELLIAQKKKLAESVGADVVLCPEEFKLGIISKNITFPGFSTFITTVTQTFHDGNMEGLLGWEKEFQHGLNHEIYEHEILSTWAGCTFMECAQFLYHNFGLLFFGVKINPSKHVILNPGDDYIIESGEIGFFLCTSTEKLLKALNTQIECGSQSELLVLQYNDDMKRNPDDVLVDLDEISADGISDHIIISASPAELKYLVKTLRENGNNLDIVYLGTEPLDSKSWVKDIEIVYGSPMNLEDLQAAGIEEASVALFLCQKSL
eukprot:TRINITY_DN4086_c0_g1_i5.p1 TRINITY_DN4086_c0_g1~~TRINITY_DN4086_c0_g1_i5.p1  ORF type:complete len:599 (+),score=108.64 TRINITY_DN4086_c0_g1_i5:150-1946(+)